MSDYIKTDRSVQPEIHVPGNIVLPHIDIETLNNGVRIHNMKTSDVGMTLLTVSLIGGRTQQSKMSQSAIATKLVGQAISGKTAAETAEIYDRLGAEITAGTMSFRNSYTLKCLKRYIPQLASAFRDNIFNPAMNAEDFDRILSQAKISLSNNLKKVSYVASREYTRMMYGAGHPFCLNVKAEDYSNLSLTDMIEYKDSYFRPPHTDVIIAGDTDEETLNYVRTAFSELPKMSPFRFKDIDLNRKMPDNRLSVVHLDGVQSCIYFARPLFSNRDPRYYESLFMTTVFGGYFSSRLSTNIREKMGYTYGISSSIDANFVDGNLVVTTQTDNKYCIEVIKAVFEEMRKMREEDMSEEELEKVKSYIIGRNVSQFDKFESWSSFYENQFTQTHSVPDLNVVNLKSDIARKMTVDRVRELANEYLKPDDYKIIVCGSPAQELTESELWP